MTMNGIAMLATALFLAAVPASALQEEAGAGTVSVDTVDADTMEADTMDADTVDAAQPAQESDPVADFYLARCAGCHTVGGGELAGPDLQPATQWPAGDLSLAVERMEKNVGELSAEQVEDLVAFLHDDRLQQRIAAARERQVQEMAATLQPPSARKGRALFHGTDPLTNGGLPCAACHRVGDRGGTLAADLTDAATRLGESALLSAAGESPGFPLMKAAYQDRPVVRQETVHLVAYLQQVAQEDEESGEAGSAAVVSGAPVGTWGTVIAAFVLLSVSALTLRRRDVPRGVRAKLVEEARRR